MRDVRFKQLPAMGSGENSWEYASLSEFLLLIPAFSYALKLFGVIPPINVLNEIVAKGEDDAGMGGGTKWKDFQISEEEYLEFVENLITNPDHNIIEDETLRDKQNYEKWYGAILSKYAKRFRKRS